MLAHILSYAMFLLALFFALLVNLFGSWSKKVYTVTYDSETVISTGSQLILIVIFNTICRQKELLQIGSDEKFV